MCAYSSSSMIMVHKFIIVPRKSFFSLKSLKTLKLVVLLAPYGNTKIEASVIRKFAVNDSYQLVRSHTRRWIKDVRENYCMQKYSTVTFIENIGQIPNIQQ